MLYRVGLYGGSFDPIHHGHLITARAVAEQVGLDRVIFLPSANPPHKDPSSLAAAQHRAEMVRLAIMAEPLFEMDAHDLRPGPSFTIDTVNHFRQQLGADVEVCWLIGADSLAELLTWREAAALVDSCRILTAARPGGDEIDWNPLKEALGDQRALRLRRDVLATPMIDISSTEIRDRVHQGRSIRYLAPDAVVQYIREQNLYSAPRLQARSGHAHGSKPA